MNTLLQILKVPEYSDMSIDQLIEAARSELFSYLPSVVQAMEIYIEHIQRAENDAEREMVRLFHLARRCAV